LVNDVSPAKLAKAAPQLIKSVKQGDILMVLADHWEPNNTAVVKMYEVAAAGGKGNP
jgi:N-methylhydantoinase B/oxoprolinase/acetone carboxylase alpha subunit